MKLYLIWMCHIIWLIWFAFNWFTGAGVLDIMSPDNEDKCDILIISDSSQLQFKGLNPQAGSDRPVGGVVLVACFHIYESDTELKTFESVGKTTHNFVGRIEYVTPT